MVLFVLVLAFPLGAAAQEREHHVVLPSIEINAKQALLIDAETGAVLFEKNADTHMPTSSMSKMITIYLVFEALRDGSIKMDDTFIVSDYAWSQEGSRMFLEARKPAKVADLIRGVLIPSGNDAAVVFAEMLGGSEAKFAEMLNKKAKELGMNDSQFKNATGLTAEGHYSTAKDLAKLALALMRDFPEHYHYNSEKEFEYNKIKQGNRNPLLYRNMGADGVKTGYTEAGGYGLTASVVRDGRRLIAVLNGMKDMQTRANESAKLIEYGYRAFENRHLVRKGQVVIAPDVWLGREPTVPLAAGADVIVTMPRTTNEEPAQAMTMFIEPISAPIIEGARLGTMYVATGIDETVEVPLLAAKDIERAPFFVRVWNRLKLLLGF